MLVMRMIALVTMSFMTLRFMAMDIMTVMPGKVPWLVCNGKEEYPGDENRYVFEPFWHHEIFNTILTHFLQHCCKNI
jgi:hypothetical protein